MGDKIGISWTDATWNCVRGCTRVSPGCQNCYAEAMAARIVRMADGSPTKYDGLVKLTARGEPRWTGKVRLDAADLALPLRWKKPRRVFVNSMSDLFHESLTNEQVAAVFGVMAASPQHTFQVLTKRAKRMREWFEWAASERLVREGHYDCTFLNHLASKHGIAGAAWKQHCDNEQDVHSPWPLPNVWLGVSVENQEAADERIPELLRTPAAVRFLSCEPLIGPVNLGINLGGVPLANGERWTGTLPLLDWVIAGCESGPDARPCSIDWLCSLRDQCAAASVPFFLKQARETPHSISLGITCGPGSKRKPGGVIELPYLDGVQHAAFPEVANG